RGLTRARGATHADRFPEGRAHERLLRRGEDRNVSDSAPIETPDATAAEVAQLIVETSALLRGAQDIDKLLVAWLRATHRFLGAETSCIATRNPGEAEARIRASQPREATWERAQLTALAGAEDTPIPLGMISARIERRGRWWGAIVAR